MPASPILPQPAVPRQSSVCTPRSPREEGPLVRPTEGPSLFPTAEELQAIAEEAGAIFRGIQPGIQTKSKFVEPLVLFDDASLCHRSSMALPVSEFTVKRVREHIVIKREEFRCANYGYTAWGLRMTRISRRV